ncbi:SPOR domain-containing protein [Alishewanella longhuensis]
MSEEPKALTVFWFRVILGPYESRRAATVDMNRLRQMGINTCQVRNWA